MKRLLACALALILLFAFGCGTSPKKVLSDAYKKLDAAESLHMETEIRFRVHGGDADGNPNDSQNMSMTMRMPTDMHKPTQTMQLGESIVYSTGEALTQSPLEFQLRVYREGDERCCAVTMDGETWYKTPSVESVIEERWDLSKEIDFFFEMGELFKRTGTEEIDGAAVTMYEGTLDSESMKALLNRFTAGPSGTPMVTLREDLWAEMPGVPVRIAIDRDGYPVLIEADAAAFVQKLMEQLLGGLMQQSAETVAFDELLISVRYSRFNAVEPIAAPENVSEELMDGISGLITPGLLSPFGF